MYKAIFANKPFLFILITAFLSILGIGLIIPVLPFIVGQYVPSGNQDTIAWYVGLLTSLYAFCQFFAAPVLGALSDRFGRRPILLLCLAGSAIGYIIFGIGGSLGILFLARIVDGITGGDISTAFAYVADVTKPQDRGKYFGIIGATVGFGFILGPSIGGIVAHISLSAPLFLAAGLTLLNMAYGYFVLPESLAKNNRTTDFSLHHLNPFTHLNYIFKNNLLKQLMIVGAFYFFAFSQMGGILSVFYKDTFNWSPGNIGFLFLILGSGDMFTQGYLSGKLLPRFGAIKLALAGFFVTAFAFAINSVLPVFPIAFFVYIYIVIYALGSGLFEPAFGGLVSGAASPQEQGRVQGASQSVQSIARILGPITGAFLYGYGHSLPWISCVILSIVGAIILMQKQKEITKHLHKMEWHEHA
ncbi:MAG TPA: MFS transporter [Patescibacteria group bacterium]|nr:MFS transporter [Patescibacteria group bacterium]